MSKRERAEDWLPKSVKARRAGPGPGRDHDPASWIADERRLRTQRLSKELTEWVTELRTRSEELDSRLRDVEAGR